MNFWANKITKMDEFVDLHPCCLRPNKKNIDHNTPPSVNEYTVPPGIISVFYTYKVFWVIYSPTGIFPTCPFHTPRAMKISIFFTFIDRTTWTVTPRTEFELAVFWFANS